MSKKTQLLREMCLRETRERSTEEQRLKPRDVKVWSAKETTSAFVILGDEHGNKLRLYRLARADCQAKRTPLEIQNFFFRQIKLLKGFIKENNGIRFAVCTQKIFKYLLNKQRGSKDGRSLKINEVFRTIGTC